MSEAADMAQACYNAEVAPFAFQMIHRAAAALGCSVQLEPLHREAARIVLPNGRVSYFRFGNLDINGAGSADIARDKAASTHFLSLAGVPVLPTLAVRSGDLEIDGGSGIITQATALGPELIVKPNSLYEGRGVQRVSSTSRLIRAVRTTLTLDDVALIQPLARGHDVRVVVMNGVIAAAYVRSPATVTGDGVRDLRALVADFLSGKRVLHGGHLPAYAEEIHEYLRTRFGTLSHVLDEGQTAVLAGAANFAAGGSILDVTTTLSGAARSVALHAAQASGLRLVGVDLMVTSRELDSRSPLQHLIGPLCAVPGADLDIVVLEVNSAPEMDGFASTGPEATGLVERLYASLLQSMIEESDA